MEQVITKTKSVIIPLAQFLTVLGIIILAQVIFKNQFITGTIVNCLLLSSVVFLGIKKSLGIAILPSLFSIATGLMAPVLLPFTPFIIMGNIILILTFNHFKNRSLILGGAIGAILKFSFLFFASSQLFSFLPAPILYAMSYPQLITGIAGTFLAFIVLKVFKI